MAKSQSTLRDEEHQLTRRALMKWSFAAGAALGISRAKVLEVLEKVHSPELAMAAGLSPTCRSVHIVGGNGAQSYFTQFWMHPAVAHANNPASAWQYTATQTVDVAGTGTAIQGSNALPLVSGPDTPFVGNGGSTTAKLAPAAQATCFVSGTNNTHTTNPPVETLGANNIISIASALQSVSPSVIPLVAVGGAGVGTAAGGATPAAVGAASGIVSLFNSAASRMGGLLANTTDAKNYHAYYDAFSQLNRAAKRTSPTNSLAYTTGSGAAQFLGTNLATQLAITPQDMTNYGVTTGTKASMLAAAQTLMVTAKAFKLGLCNAVALPWMQDDPHGHFDSGANKTLNPIMRSVMDGFMTDMVNATDPVTNERLSDALVITMHGDTTKDANQAAGWGDGTAKNHNVIYCVGAGNLFPGWFGQLSPDGTVMGFGTDGKQAAFASAPTQTIANAAIAYAIARRDDRATQPFANGTTIGGIFGPLKAT